MAHRDELRQQAKEDCLRHVEALFDETFVVELGESMEQWSPVMLRHLFEQPMVLWQRYGTFEVILDAENRPVGYVDESQWVGCAWEPLNYHEVLDLIKQTPLALPKLVIEKMEQGEQKCMVVLLKQVASEEPPARWLAQINGAKRSIISIEPVEEGHDGARG